MNDHQSVNIKWGQIALWRSCFEPQNLKSFVMRLIKSRRSLKSYVLRLAGP